MQRQCFCGAQNCGSDQNGASLSNLFKRISGKVVVVGSVNADFTVKTECLPHPGETVFGGPLQILPGGKSTNQAVAAARCGADVSFMGVVGQDEWADYLSNCLAEVGVCTKAVAHVRGPSGMAVIMVDAHGENAIVYFPGSNASLTPEYIKKHKDAITQASVMGLCLESPLDTVVTAAQIAHEAGLTVLLNDSPFIEDLPSELVKASDILLVNEHELAQLIKIVNEHELAQLIKTSEPPDGAWESIAWSEVAQVTGELGFDRVIVTLGPKGFVTLDNGDIQIAKACSVKAVDTTGCGDAFMGSVLAGLASGFSLADSAHLASYVAAYAATGTGAQTSYGTPEQILQSFAG